MDIEWGFFQFSLSNALYLCKNEGGPSKERKNMKSFALT